MDVTAHVWAAEGGEVGFDDLMTQVERPLTDWIARYTDSPWLLWASDNLIEPSVRILTIALIAMVALHFVRRALHRAVERAQDPDALSAHRLRQRIGLIDESTPVHSPRRGQRAESIGALASAIAGFVVWVMALFMVLGTFGVNLGPLIAGAGIVGIAIGFGAQDLVKDFISGVSMLLEDQYGVGDVIDSGDAIGVVEGITLRTTRIRDVTGTLWHVPNGEIRRVGNMSQEWARALLDIGVAYGADIEAASRLILGVASHMAEEEAYAELILEPPEIWGVQELGDSSVDIRLVVKTRPGEQWAIARELRRRIKNAMDAAQVEIPFPQRTVWLRTEAPVAFGDGEAAPFEAPVPDDPTIAEAIENASGPGDSAVTEPADQAPEPG